MNTPEAARCTQAPFQDAMSYIYSLPSHSTKLFICVQVMV